MKPAPFEYRAPQTVAETAELLAEHGDEGKLLAGGQSLVPLMNFRFAAPEVVIDLNRVAGLDRIDVGDEVTIGANVRQQAVERSDAVAQAVPLLPEALGHVGHVAIRSRGTVAGSVAHADPAAELPAVLLALDGAVTVSGRRGVRRIAARDLFLDIFTTAIESDELITSVHFPRTRGGSALEEVARRHGDFAIAGAVARVACGADGAIAEASLALFGVDAVPVRAAAAEALLVGADPGDAAAFQEAAQVAAAELEPADDAQVPGAYRRRIAAVVARRALSRAAQRSVTR